MSFKTMFLFSALSIYVIFGKRTDGNGNGPKRPTYTDKEIIASIKDELNQRLLRHKTRGRKQEPQQPSVVSTDSPLPDDLFSSTMTNDSIDFDDFTSTEMELEMEIDESSEIDLGARKEFADDFPAIARTVKNLNEALSSLDYFNDMDVDIDFNIIDAIKDKIQTLLDEYAQVESTTNAFLSLIHIVFEKEDERRRLLLPKATREEKGYNEQEEELEDADVDMEISEVLLEQFGGDIDAIQEVMGRLVDALNNLNEPSDAEVEDEDKGRLSDMIEELLDEYILIISDTNGLINLFKQFYRRYGHHFERN